jgi:hypothetical protein
MSMPAMPLGTPPGPMAMKLQASRVLQPNPALMDLLGG